MGYRTRSLQQHSFISVYSASSSSTLHCIFTKTQRRQKPLIPEERENIPLSYWPTKQIDANLKFSPYFDKFRIIRQMNFE